MLLLGSLPGTAAEQAPPARTLRDCPTCPEMVVIPAGSFLMGTPKAIQVPTEVPAELDPVSITITRPFALGRFELTRGEYQEFVSATGYSPPDPHCRTWVADLKAFRDLPRGWQQANIPAAPTDRHPASCISWHDARAYLAWLSKQTGRNYRLPSETEWEYAARAGTRTLYPTGNDRRRICRQANLHDRRTAASYPLAWTVAPCYDGFADVAPVGSLQPNNFGLYDMLGNVWEWAEDCASLSYFGRPLDQRAWTWDGGCKRRIQRGGGWITGPERARPGFHGDGDDSDRADFAGMRVARDL
jgi:formylglycine-generating enzyme required for sulfatase activity